MLPGVYHFRRALSGLALVSGYLLELKSHDPDRAAELDTIIRDVRSIANRLERLYEPKPKR